MKLTESRLRQIIKEELSKPPGWVSPPPGWTWNDRQKSYDHRGGQVTWDAAGWVVTSGDGEWGSTPVSSPEEGFAEIERGT